MLNPFICGSFHHQQEEDDDQSLGNSPCSTPRKSRKSTKDSKNPYATRGLDKFSALLADLEEKRQKIYSQVDPQDISFVRFVYSSSNDCVPIIVKLKDHNRTSFDKDDTKDKAKTEHKTEVLNKSPPIEQSTVDQETNNNQSRLDNIDKKKNDNKKRLLSWNNLKLHRWRRPSCYMPVFIILILLLLVFFGRSVTILCTSIGWYLIPTLSSKRPAKKKQVVKKQLVRRFSEISPRSHKNINTGDIKDKSSPHARQNSF